MKRIPSLCAAGLMGLSLSGTAQAEGDPKPKLSDLITIDSVAETIASFAISALRTQMEVTYDHIATDVLRGTITLSGVTLRPQLPYDRAGQCVVTLERATFDAGKQRFDLQAANLSATIIGLNAEMSCLPKEVAFGLRAAGYTDIQLDRLNYQADYVHGSGEMRVNASAAVNNLATLDLDIAGSLLPRLSEFGYADDPAIRVQKAVLGLKDMGGWERLSSQLPENFRNPDVIESMGLEQLTDALSNGGTRALTASERLFVEDLMAQVAGFIRDSGELTIEAQLPGNGIVLEPEVYGDPAQLIQALAPDARVYPIAQSQLVGAELLSRDASTLSSAEKLALARALLTGTGVPLADARVPALLAPVIAENGPDAAEASLLSARALMAHNPLAAYENALAASSARLPGTLSVLDALEQRLTTTQVVTAQDNYLAAAEVGTAQAALDGLEDVRALRALSLAHFTGLGEPRSYRRAYYYALIAEAAGDIGARPIREDIEARFANRGEAVTTRWRSLRGEIQELALKDWISLNLPERFGRNN